MPYTPTIQNTNPTIDGSFDTWGQITNDRQNETYADINGIAAVANANESAIPGKVSKSGDTMTGDLLLPDVAQSNVRSAGFRGIPPRTVNVSATLVATDAGGEVLFEGPSGSAITIPTVGSVGFQAGAAITVRNFTASNLGLSQGAGVSLRIPLSGATGNRTIPPWGIAIIKMEKSNEWLAMGQGVA